jgi:hypothetical protein
LGVRLDDGSQTSLQVLCIVFVHCKAADYEDWAATMGARFIGKEQVHPVGAYYEEVNEAEAPVTRSLWSHESRPAS